MAQAKTVNKSKNSQDKEDHYSGINLLQGKDILEKSPIEKALRLLSHSAERGIEVDKGVIDAVIKTKNALVQKDLASEGESEFWHAFKVLAETISPVTIESLDPLNKKFSKWLVFFLVLLLLLNLVFIGHYQFRLGKIDTLMGDVMSKSQELKKMSGNDPFSKEAAKIITFKLIICNNLVKLSAMLWLDSDASDCTKGGNNVLLSLNMIETFHKNQNVVKIYFLPFLYGLLGSLAYVLRKLNSEIENVTFIKESTVNYTLRLGLGVLSGLAIGLYIPVGNGGNQISAFALAFVAGYSVEILFSVLDGFVSSLSKA